MPRLNPDRGRGLFLAALCLMLPILFSACSDDDDPVLPDPGDGEPAIRQVTNEFDSWEYLQNRFFRLDLPEVDLPGRGEGWVIDPSSIRVYEYAGPGMLGELDIQNVAVYEDTTGVFWSADGSPDADFQVPYISAERWRERSFDRRLDRNGELVAIDLGDWVPEDALLAVAYRITNGYETIPIGDLPGIDDDSREEIDGELYYRMKLLKAPVNWQNDATFDLMLRNVYRICPLNAGSFDRELRIERNDPGAEEPEVDILGIPYVTLFGLDRYTESYEPVPDGVADFLDDELFDWWQGLLFFPQDMPHPFAAEPEQYEAYAANGDFDFESSYLSQPPFLTPEIYDPRTLPADYELYGTFRFLFTYWEYVPEALDEVDLSRLPWMRAAVPLPTGASSPVYVPESRVEAIRWFIPRERVLTEYLEPGASGTVDALELYLWAEDGSWDEGDWGGITRGVSRVGIDVSEADSVRIWVNDSEPDPSLRSGTLHIDYGWISEDGFWPVKDDSPVVGTFEHEDGILGFEYWDGVFTQDEDIGLNPYEPDREVYDASYDYGGMTTVYTGETISGIYAGPSQPYPLLNGTAYNNREDDEDLNDNQRMDTDNVYRSVAIELDSPADFDFVLDGPVEAAAQAVDEDRAWRMYTIPLNAAIDLSDDPTQPEINPRWITHLRLWFEDPGRPGAAVQLQIARLEFFGGEKSRVVPGLTLYDR